MPNSNRCTRIAAFRYIDLLAIHNLRVILGRGDGEVFYNSRVSSEAITLNDSLEIVNVCCSRSKGLIRSLTLYFVVIRVYFIF